MTDIRARIVHGGPVMAVAFSSDGRLLALRGGNTTRVVAVESGREVARIEHSGAVNAVAFSPDGRLVATAGDDNRARVVAVEGSREVARIEHGGAVNAVAFSPDGELLATASRDGTARIMAVADGHEVARVEHGGPVSVMAFSPNGRRLDEAGDSGDLNPLGGPEDLPPGVFFVISQRPTAKCLRANTQPVRCTIDATGTENLTDMRAFLEQRRGLAGCSRCPCRWSSSR